MSRVWGMGLLIVVVLVAEAQAGYRELATEMDSYQPPPVVTSQLESKSLVVTSGAIVPAEDAFQAQRAALNKQEEQWSKSISEPDQGMHFLIPDPAVLARVQAAGQDDDAAGKALADGFTLETIEALVLLRSPAVRAKASEFEGVLAGYSQADDLDTILRRYAALTKSVMTGVGGMTNPDPVTLKFPFPGVLALKGEIVDQEARVAREGLEAARRDAVTTVRKAYAQLLYLQAAKEITRSQLRLIANQQQTVSTRYQAGDTGFDMVLKVGIEVEQLKEELTSLIEEQGNVEVAIRAALSLPERIGVGRPVYPGLGAPSAGLLALNSLALERRQEIKAKQAMVGKAERMVEMAETMIYPGFTPNRSLFEQDMVTSVGQASAMAGAEATPVASEPGVGALLPKTPWYGSDDAYLRQARQQIQALKMDVEAERAATMLGVREAWYRLDKARRQEALYRERITTLTQAGLDTASQAYAAGRVSFSQFIESANAWLAARLGLARAQADMIRSQADLDAAVGVSSGYRKAMDNKLRNRMH